MSILLLLFNGFIVPHINHIIAERQAIAYGSSNANNNKSDREKSISELYVAQVNMVINPKIKRQYLYEIYKKITIAFSIFTNAFLGLSLAVIIKKKSVVNSILLFISCFILYQLYVFLFIGLEDMEFFNPFVIMMIPLIVNVIIGSSLIAIDTIVNKITLMLNKNTP
jgi:lipopolysaccharide export LptBFGC system permease protein LptF